MNAMTTHQIVIKAHRLKKLLSGHYLKFGYGWHFQSFPWVINQPYTPFLPKLLLISCHKDLLFNVR